MVSSIQWSRMFDGTPQTGRVGDESRVHGDLFQVVDESGMSDASVLFLLPFDASVPVALAGVALALHPALRQGRGACELTPTSSVR